MSKVVSQSYDDEIAKTADGQFTGQRVYSVDPKIAMQSLQNKTFPHYGELMSPTYSQPPLGSVLKTPKDSTSSHVKLPSSKPASLNWSSLPKVPQKKHLLNYGGVVPAETIKSNWNHTPADQPFSIDDLMNDLPMAHSEIPQIPQSAPQQSVNPQSAPQQFLNPSSAPQQFAPQQFVNSSSAPQQSVPQQSAPQQSAPQQSAPQQSAPQQSTPQQSTPQQFVNPSSVPQQEKIDDAKFRANYRVKFSILRDAYQQMAIPEPRDDQSCEEIEAMYNQYVKRIMIDQSVEQNNVYLLILWLVIEVVGGRFFKLPFKGYTKNQFKYMKKYRMLLIELGERNQATGIGEGWPVELRILAMAAFNGVIFILVQMLAKRVGMDGESADNTANQLREMINDFLTQNKGGDVLKRAEQADADNPPPPPSDNESNEPPLGNIGNMLGNLAGMFSGGGGGGDGLGGLANLFGNMNQSKPKEKPKMKKPTSFAARRKKPSKNT
jgi:hypothetical protein